MCITFGYLGPYCIHRKTILVVQLQYDYSDQENLIVLHILFNIYGEKPLPLTEEHR